MTEFTRDTDCCGGVVFLTERAHLQLHVLTCQRSGECVEQISMHGRVKGASVGLFI